MPIVLRSCRRLIRHKDSVCASTAAREFRKRKRHSIPNGLFSPLFQVLYRGAAIATWNYGIHVVANCFAITGITAYCGVDHQDG